MVFMVTYVITKANIKTKIEWGVRNGPINKNGRLPFFLFF